MFETRPSLPRYNYVWDVDLVLAYLKGRLSPTSELNLKPLTLKLVMLLALLSGQRCQTLHTLQTNNMKLEETKCVFLLKRLLKNI